MLPRHPIASPSAAPTGMPITSAIEFPRNTVAVARPARPAGTSRAVTGASIDQNTPCASAQTTRATITTA